MNKRNNHCQTNSEKLSFRHVSWTSVFMGILTNGNMLMQILSFNKIKHYCMKRGGNLIGKDTDYKLEKKVPENTGTSLKLGLSLMRNK